MKRTIWQKKKVIAKNIKDIGNERKWEKRTVNYEKINSLRRLQLQPQSFPPPKKPKNYWKCYPTCQNHLHLSTEKNKIIKTDVSTF